MKSGRQYLPNSTDEIVKQMLERIGVSSIEDLFKDVPEDLELKGEPNLPEAVSELEVSKHVEEVFSLNRFHPDYLCFLGGGIWHHYVPAVVDEVASRSEFYTSYTPYQPEVSQGMLQALFEYQSLICDLTSMGAANSSMYDWATALGEAARMAVRVKRRGRVVTARNIGPERLEVLKTYCEPAGISVKTVEFDQETGEVDLERLKEALKDDASAVYLENPNFFGVVEGSVEEAAELTSRAEALMIVGVDPASLGLLKAPGDYGADIVVGEGQPLGLHMNFGGPLLGIFACRDDQSLIRQMPGRIIGMTTSKDGSKRGFTMVLQTREQHIRRENATSNICTNEALCAVRAAIYLSLMGPEGLKQLSRIIMVNSHYAAKVLSEIKGIKSPYFTSIFFKDFTVETDRMSCEELQRRLLKHKVLGGLPLSRYFKELPRVSLFSATEVHSKRDINRLDEAVRNIMEGA